MRDCDVVILAGGLGTRLRPVIGDIPKVLAPIGGRPFLEYVLTYLRRQGVTDVIVSTGYAADQITRVFGSGCDFGIRIRYSNEERPLGTAGALRLAAEFIQRDHLLVLNGDTLFPIDLNHLNERHVLTNALVTIALATLNTSKRFGVVELAPDDRIVAFHEKRLTSDRVLVNGGVYMIRRSVLELIDTGTTVSLEREIFPPLIGRGLYGLPYDAAFVDIGVPDDYEALAQNPERLEHLMGF